MDTRSSSDFDAYSAAVAKILDARKHELRKTFDQLEAESGVNARTLKRLLSGERAMRLGQFHAIVGALELVPSDVVSAAEAQVAGSLAKTKP